MQSLEGARTIRRVATDPDPHPYAELLRRIEIRRENMNNISETQACLKAGLGKDCIRTIRRKNAPRAEALTALARALECPASYFLDAVGITESAGFSEEAPGPEEEAEVGAEDASAPAGYVYVRTLEDRPGMGGPSFSESDNYGAPQLVPERLIRTDLRGGPENFLFLDVEGPSMEPILESGDRVMIDLRRKSPVQPGIFVVNEGIGYVAKWVQFVQASDPPRFRITSENPRFDPYEVLASDARIIGRVVWYARKL